MLPVGEVLITVLISYDQQLVFYWAIGSIKAITFSV